MWAARFVGEEGRESHCARLMGLCRAHVDLAAHLRDCACDPQATPEHVDHLLDAGLRPREIGGQSRARTSVRSLSEFIAAARRSSSPRGTSWIGSRGWATPEAGFTAEPTIGDREIENRQHANAFRVVDADRVALSCLNPGANRRRGYLSEFHPGPPRQDVGLEQPPVALSGAGLERSSAL